MVTQEQVDQCVLAIRQQWNEMLIESGKSQTMFVATSKTAIQFLGDYENIRQQLAEEGWLLPDLIEGVKVSFHDEEPQE